MAKVKVEDLEKRIAKLELMLGATPTKPKSATSEKELAIDLDKFMQKHGGLFQKGMMFSGLAMPSQNPRRLVRWSGCGGFKNDIEFDQFIETANTDIITKFSGNFSSIEKLAIVKSLIKDGPLAQKEILERTKISQGQFYHHIKDLLSSKMIEKIEKDKYDLSPMGHVLSISFLGLINAFAK
ncbi:MAG: winged helix-turn-helix transcriptional regulator [Bdellovibrionales bacterium]|nr:winged helix-turn-helix transcriptional regulator [Bdellovibrionales bacterium]